MSSAKDAKIWIIHMIRYEKLTEAGMELLCADPVTPRHIFNEIMWSWDKYVKIINRQYDITNRINEEMQ